MAHVTPTDLARAQRGAAAARRGLARRGRERGAAAARARRVLGRQRRRDRGLGGRDGGRDALRLDPPRQMRQLPLVVKEGEPDVKRHLY